MDVRKATDEYLRMKRPLDAPQDAPAKRARAEGEDRGTGGSQVKGDESEKQEAANSVPMGKIIVEAT